MKFTYFHLPSVALTLLIGACKKAPEVEPPPPPPVTVAHPAMMEVQVFAEFPATLEALSNTEIRARVRGILQSKNFEEGMPVKAGQLLFEIEPASYQQAVDAAKADLLRAEAGQQLAEKRLARLQQALAKNAVSEIEVEIASAEFAQASASVEQAQAKLSNAELDLSYTRITAPFDGRISRNLGGTDNLVGFAEPTLLARLVDDSQIQAYFEVPERDVIRFLEARANKDAARVVREKEIGLVLADGTIYDIPGKIDFINNTVDPQTRTNQVRAVFDNPRGTLAAGLYGLIRVPMAVNPDDPENKMALTIPSVALQRDISGSFVWTVDNQNVVHRSQVTLGRNIPADTSGGEKLSLVVKGLTPEDRVIIRGTQRAREGAKVTPELAPPRDAAQAPTAEEATSL